MGAGSAGVVVVNGREARDERDWRDANLVDFQLRIWTDTSLLYLSLEDELYGLPHCAGCASEGEQQATSAFST